MSVNNRTVAKRVTITNAFDKDMNPISVRSDDPRWKTGEIKARTNFLELVKDKDGNIFKVLKTDPRIKTGELIIRIYANLDSKLTNASKRYRVWPDQIDGVLYKWDNVYTIRLNKEIYKRFGITEDIYNIFNEVNDKYKTETVKKWCREHKDD